MCRLFSLILMISLLAGAVGADQSATSAKTMCVIGDSYVRNHTRPYEEAWHYKAAKALDMNYLNFGINGNCVAFDRSDRGFGRPMRERISQIPAETDILLIIAGHNDAVIAQTPDKQRIFSDSLRNLCDALRLQLPHTAIGYVLPWNVAQAGFDEIRAIIMRICEEKNIPVFDPALKCGIRVNDTSFRQRYFLNPGDNAHLNAEGHDLILAKALEYLKRLNPAVNCN